jgi:SAM-dependent methyltransferase
LVTNAGTIVMRIRRKAAAALLGSEVESETSGLESLEELGIESKGGERGHYQRSHGLALRVGLRNHPFRPDDVFLDIGSGKGRVVLQAAEYPFKRVRGIELSGALNEIAERNVERNRAQLACQEIELAVGDVLEAEFPDDVTVVYLYNTVRGDLMRRLLDRILASVDRNPRPLRIIYNNPVEHEALVRTARIRPVRSWPPPFVYKALRISVVRVYAV